MFNKISPLTRSFIILSSLSVFLIFVRCYKTDSTFGLGLIWNLFLAGVPVFFALVSRRLVAKKTIATWILLALWMLFLPNSYYIITDLGHLHHLPGEIWWFDSFIIFHTAFIGVLLAVYSLFVVHQTLDKLLTKALIWPALGLSFLLSGFGIYLGRFLRFNSWDLFTNPLSLIKLSMFEVTNPLALKMTLLFGLAQLVIYFSFWIFKNSLYETIKND